MDREEIIHSASVERNTAKDVTVKRGDRVTSRKLTDYISDLGDFLYFVHYQDNFGMSWPEAYLASPEWQHKQHARTFGL